MTSTKASLKDAEEGGGKTAEGCPSNSSESYGNMNKVPMLDKLAFQQNKV